MAQTRTVYDASAAFTSYMAQARSIPFLTAEQEVALAVRIQRGGRNGEQARDELVRSQLRYVVNLARKFLRPNVTLEDLVQEGNLGLFRAAEKFDGSLGYRFYTYARAWVEQAMREHVEKRAFVVKVPARTSTKIAKMNRAVGKLGSDGHTPTDEEIAAEMGETVPTVRKLAEFALTPVSLNTPIFDGDGEVGDRIEDTSTPSAEAVVIEKDFRAKLAAALGNLNERELAVITGRFDLDGEGKKSLEELGDIYGVSRERIRQIEVRALEKLSKGQTGQALKTFLRN